jgi:hypothetical protein
MIRDSSILDIPKHNHLPPKLGHRAYSPIGEEPLATKYEDNLNHIETIVSSFLSLSRELRNTIYH